MTQIVEHQMGSKLTDTAAEAYQSSENGHFQSGLSQLGYLGNRKILGNNVFYLGYGQYDCCENRTLG